MSPLLLLQEKGLSHVIHIVNGMWIVEASSLPIAMDWKWDFPSFILYLCGLWKLINTSAIELFMVHDETLGI